MRDATLLEHKNKVNWKNRLPEVKISHINEGQDDFVELIRVNNRHFILRGWEVEAHYSCKSAAYNDLSRFIEEEVMKG